MPGVRAGDGPTVACRCCPGGRRSPRSVTLAPGQPRPRACRTGQVVWRFRRTGAAALNHPSLALPLPGGNILVNDDYNDRVIVISTKTNRIVWQYGHDGVPGRAAGYLDNPDGVDLAPPDSLLMTHATTMSRP
jgi:hypothetical protein